MIPSSSAEEHEARCHGDGHRDLIPDDAAAAELNREGDRHLRRARCEEDETDLNRLDLPHLRQALTDDGAKVAARAKPLAQLACAGLQRSTPLQDLAPLPGR